MKRLWWFVPVLMSWALLVAEGAPFRPGDVFLANDGSTVTEVDVQDGSDQQSMATTPKGFTTNDNVSGAGGVALDEQGNLYVSVLSPEYGVVKFDSSGQKVATFEIGGSKDFRGLAVQNGVMYVATSSGVRRYDASTGASAGTILGSGGAFRDTAFDASGNLYGLKGTSIVQWDVGNLSGSGTTLSLNGPNDGRAIAFDADNSLYVTNGTGRNILKYTYSGGSFSTDATVITPSVGIGSGDAMLGLGYDPGRDVFYASHTNPSFDQILSFGPANTTAAPVAGTSGYQGARYLDVMPTPELSTLLLLGIGVATAFGTCRRKRKEAKHDADQSRS